MRSRVLSIAMSLREEREGWPLLFSSLSEMPPSCFQVSGIKWVEERTGPLKGNALEKSGLSGMRANGARQPQHLRHPNQCACAQNERAPFSQDQGDWKESSARSYVRQMAAGNLDWRNPSRTPNGRIRRSGIEIVWDLLQKTKNVRDVENQLHI